MEIRETEEFRTVMADLIKILDSDRQSVSNQLVTLSDNHLVFQLVNFSRSLKSSSSKNPELANFIDQGYVSFQVTGIRGIGSDTHKGANSLPNAILCLKKNRSLFRRANYVCHEGLSYFREEEEKNQRNL